MDSLRAVPCAGHRKIRAAPFPVRARLSLLVLAALLAWPPVVPAAAPPPASTADPAVTRAALGTWVHGITEEIAVREVGREGVPTLLELLADPDFSRRDNVVAFLWHLGGTEARAGILAFLDSPPGPPGVPEEERALLMAPRALGAIAARGDAGALEALLEATSPGGRSGILSSAARWSDDPTRLRADLEDAARLGLALSGTPEARDRLAALGALDAHADLAGDAAARDVWGEGTEALPAPDPTFPGDLLPQGLDQQSVVHDSGLSYANHVEAPSPMDDARLDLLLRDASLRAGREDFTQDVACCATVSREGTQRSFGSPGDGLDVIDDRDEMVAVLGDPVSRVKIVREIRWCGATGVNIIGCAYTPGNGMALVRLSNPAMESVLWIHEYGHNTGLGHHSDSRYIMYGVNYGTNRALTQAECDSYHSPSSATGMTPVETGPCADSDADGVHDGADNCPAAPNSDQTDSDLDGVGDACEGDAGECGNGVREQGEQCDGSDLGGLTCEAIGYAGGTLACRADCTFDTSGCFQDPEPVCGNGVHEDLEQCDGQDLGGATCESLGYDGGTLGCNADCSFDTSGCTTDPVCGDGVQEGTEQCDGADLGGQTCPGLGHDGGTLGCNPDCTFDESGCTDEPVCGDGVREGTEQCDGADLGGQTCPGLGHDGGTLACNPDCTFDESGCTDEPVCGDGVREGTEQCDGADLGGQTCVGLGHDGGDLGCNPDCTWDSGSCFDEAGCADADGDGFQDASCNSHPKKGDGDCDDSDPAVNPDAEEICNDGIDQDCDGRDKTKGCGGGGNKGGGGGKEPKENCRNGTDDDGDGLADCADPDCAGKGGCR